MSENEPGKIASTQLVTLDVLPYSDDHKKILDGQPFAPRVASLIARGLTVSFEEILTLGMFTEQKHQSGWQTFNELKKRAPSRFAEMRDYFSAEDGRLGARFSPLDTGNHRTERIGVALAIATANDILETTDADWEKVDPDGKNKVMDFKYAASKHGLIHLEAKGCVSDSSTLRPSTVGNAMGHIREKKEEKRDKKFPGTLLGTIAVLPVLDGSEKDQPPARVFLLDPPIEPTDWDLRWLRLHSRLNYYGRVIGSLTTSNLTLALANRLETLRNPNLYSAMDGLPLVNVRRERLRAPTFKTMTKFNHGRIVGRTVAIKRGCEDLLFFGFDPDIIQVVIDQKFDLINTFRSRHASIRIKIESQVITVDASALMGLGLKSKLESGRANIQLVVSGNIAVLPSGIAGGVLKIDEGLRIPSARVFLPR